MLLGEQDTNLESEIRTLPLDEAMELRDSLQSRSIFENKAMTIATGRHLMLGICTIIFPALGDCILMLHG